MSINLNDYKIDDERHDWDAYYKAQEDAGERCYRCKEHIFKLFDKHTGGRRLCTQCTNMDKDEEVDHSNTIRCPKCGHTENVYDSGEYHLYEEGEHDVTCQECNNEYTVETMVEYTFTSPPRLGKEQEDEEASLKCDKHRINVPPGEVCPACDDECCDQALEDALGREGQG